MAKRLESALVANALRCPTFTAPTIAAQLNRGAAALKQALEMPLEERQRRYTPTLAHLPEHDVDR